MLENRSRAEPEIYYLENRSCLSAFNIAARALCQRTLSNSVVRDFYLRAIENYKRNIFLNAQRRAPATLDFRRQPHLARLSGNNPLKGHLIDTRAHRCQILSQPGLFSTA
jgi:hypothetical protein